MEHSPVGLLTRDALVHDGQYYPPCSDDCDLEVSPDDRVICSGQSCDDAAWDPELVPYDDEEWYQR